jgi:hypothetical protein
MVAAVALLAMNATLSQDSGRVAAGPPTPTTTPATATPSLQIPDAPSDFDFSVPGSTTGGLTWIDNSDSEDGFRLRKTVGFALVPPEAIGPTVFAEVPANTTEAAFPELSDEEFCAGVEISIVAFNGAGESAPAEGPNIQATDCIGFTPLSPTATAQATVTGPTTGTGADSGGGPPTGVLALAASAVALIAGGVGAFVLWRKSGAS